MRFLDSNRWMLVGLILGCSFGIAMGNDSPSAAPYAMEMTKAGGEWTCELRINDQDPGIGYRDHVDRILSDMKDLSGEQGFRILEKYENRPDGLHGFVVRQDQMIHAEFMRITPSGVGVHIIAKGSLENRDRMVDGAVKLIRDIDFQKRRPGDGKDVYQTLRKRVLPPVGIDRASVEAVFGPPDRMVETMEPISNIPLPHHQYDIASSDGKQYYLCVKYDGSKAVWVYLANMDEEGLPGGVSDRQIDYWKGIRKLELMEVLYRDMLETSAWQRP